MRPRRFPAIYPTRNLAGLFFVAAAMWYAASSQNNGASYLLLFALLGVFVVSIPHTLLNLGGLEVAVEAIKPVFAGQEVAVPIEITNKSPVARCGIAVCLSGHTESDQAVDEISAGRATRLTLRFAAPARGEHEIERFCLTTVYPLGFVRAMKPSSVSRRFVVYPNPAGDPKLPVDHVGTNQTTARNDFGEGDDFAGVRAYVPGESQRHIDWKAVARGQALMTKQFVTETGGTLYVDLALAPGENLEDRLSQLALWVIEAERAHRPYGLRLPNIEIEPSLGENHFHRCLRTLALFK